MMAYEPLWLAAVARTHRAAAPHLAATHVPHAGHGKAISMSGGAMTHLVVSDESNRSLRYGDGSNRTLRYAPVVAAVLGPPWRLPALLR